MKLKVSLLLVVLVAGFVIFRQCSGPSNYKNLPPAARGEWVAFGDSLTAGVGAGDGNDYPTLLADKLGVTIRNMGVAGETTHDAMSRLDQVVALEPRVVLLCLGGNDGLRSMSREQMFANLGAMIDRLHAGGSFVVLVGIRSASLRDGNSSGFKQLAKEKQVFYIPDMLDGVIGKPALMSDYIHPNDAGYQVIAERLANELTPLLSQLR